MRGRNLIGETFDRLTVIDYCGKNSHSQNLWLCRCLCDNEKIYNTSDLLSGNSKSCGCLRKDNTALIGKCNATHGLSRTSEYKAWLHMLDRCNNPQNQYFDHYGGRGIAVCDRWLRSFEAFYSDLGPKPSSDLSIERNDVNGNYEPGNCRWATDAEQALNKQTTIRVYYQGKEWPLKLLCQHLNVSYDAVRYRVMQKKLPVEIAITETINFKQGRI